MGARGPGRQRRSPMNPPSACEGRTPAGGWDRDCNLTRVTGRGARARQDNSGVIPVRMYDWPCQGVTTPEGEDCSLGPSRESPTVTYHCQSEEFNCFRFVGQNHRLATPSVEGAVCRRTLVVSATLPHDLHG